jgi:hypothetical protein
MSNSSRVESALTPRNVTVSFGERFQASEQFDLVFKEGMALVERTAAYLEGPGRADAKRLKAPANVLYATESMRLTTRLLDLASWLLIRRAIKEGEMSEAEAQRKRKNVSLQGAAKASHVQGLAACRSAGADLGKLCAERAYRPPRPRLERQRRGRRLRARARKPRRHSDGPPARGLRQLSPAPCAVSNAQESTKPGRWRPGFVALGKRCGR